jgi:uncharacterized protein (DUF362 family)
MNRREFVAKAASAVAGLGLIRSKGRALQPVPGAKSRVIEVSGPAAVLEGRKVDGEVVRRMLRRGMTALTGRENPWEHFFSPSDRVGLKINTLGRPLLFTHHELVNALAAELVDFGIAENNIIVWDRWEPHMLASKFTVNVSGRGVRCYGTANWVTKVERLDRGVVYRSENDSAEDREGGVESVFSSIFTRDCDKIVNMAVLKDHGNCGVTLCLKNLAYGVCNNNGRFHKPPFIGPFIADFCAQPIVRKKAVLHLIDGLEGCFDRGPVPDSTSVLFAPRTLWLGTDPVALDAVGFRVIDAERLRRGLPDLKDSSGYYGGPMPVDHIDLAAAKGVGTSDMSRISLEKMSV